MSDTGMYEIISSNKRKSVFLMICMILLVAFVAAVFGAYFGGKEAAGPYAAMFAAIGLGVAGVGALASYYSGTNVIMAVSGAHEAKPEDERQLHNLVEEMCIASGLPKPKIYIIEDSAPNAFATGRDPDHSAIAMTRGLMEKLNRNELMGVVAHEMSHVQNYDIRFATLMTVMVGTIVLMCDMFWRMSLFGAGRRRRSSRNSGDGNMQAVIAVAAILLMILAPLFAMFIQMASSRKREYLADATGAKMTRNPEALARALEKIAGDPDPLEAANRGTQQLYIVNPLKGKALASKQNLFSTHPPIRERIQRLREMT